MKNTPGTVDQALTCETQQGLPSDPFNGLPAHRLLPIGWNAPLTSTPIKVTGRPRPGHSLLPKNGGETAHLLIRTEPYPVIMFDVKGDHGVVAEALGGQVFKADSFGTDVRLNPLQAGGPSSATFTSGMGMK